jgi:hypothetical protein
MQQDRANVTSNENKSLVMLGSEDWYFEVCIDTPQTDLDLLFNNVEHEERYLPAEIYLRFGRTC